MSLPNTTAATAPVTNSVPVPGLSFVSSGLQSSVTNLVSTGHGYIDRFFPPHKRQAWKEWLTNFATQNPRLASFLLSQLALSGPALALFIIMTLTIVIFALVAGILVGLLGALLFIVAALGFALIILLPTLFFTTAAAVFFWLWGMGTYYIVKWFNEKPVPGIHTELAEGVKEQSGLGDLPGLNGESLLGGGTGGGAGGSGAEAETPPARGERPAAEHHQQQQTHHRDGKENATSSGRESKDESSGTHRKAKKLGGSGGGGGGGGGVDGTVKDSVGQAHGAVGGVTKKLGVGL
jgi:xanthosine utilization system XapX-like protein